MNSLRKIIVFLAASLGSHIAFTGQAYAASQCASINSATMQSKCYNDAITRMEPPVKKYYSGQSLYMSISTKDLTGIPANQRQMRLVPYADLIKEDCGNDGECYIRRYQDEIDAIQRKEGAKKTNTFSPKAEAIANMKRNFPVTYHSDSPLMIGIFGPSSSLGAAAQQPSLDSIPEARTEYDISHPDGEEHEQEYPDGMSPDAWYDFVEEKYDWLLNQKVPTEEKKAFVKFYIADPGLFSHLSRHMQEAADRYSD